MHGWFTVVGCVSASACTFDDDSSNSVLLALFDRYFILEFMNNTFVLVLMTIGWGDNDALLSEKIILCVNDYYHYHLCHDYAQAWVVFDSP